MPKRVAPKRGWKAQGSPINPPIGPAIYTPEIIARLCKRHAISSDHHGWLLRHLEHWGHAYNSFETDADTKPTKAQVKAAILEVKQNADKLLASVNSFDQETDGRMARAWFDLMQDATRNKEAPMRKIGAWVDFPTEDGTGSRFYDWDDIRGSLRLLRLISDKAISELPKGKGGRKAHTALDFWVMHVGSFWLEKLGRQFTIDIEKGEGTTPAYLFLAECLKPLDPRAVRSLPTAMKRARPHLIRDRIDPNKVQRLLRTKNA